jgi:hypothetical protein
VRLNQRLMAVQWSTLRASRMAHWANISGTKVMG